MKDSNAGIGKKKGDDQNGIIKITSIDSAHLKATVLGEGRPTKNDQIFFGPVEEGGANEENVEKEKDEEAEEELKRSREKRRLKRKE